MDSKDRKWKIELTEKQLCIMIEALEDWHRFISGQCSMANATSYIDNAGHMHQVRDILDHNVKPLMFPELRLNQDYSWNGGQQNPALSAAAAISYLLYREARHKMVLASKSSYYNVYTSDTLTCEAQGTMIKVELIKEK